MAGEDVIHAECKVLRLSVACAALALVPLASACVSTRGGPISYDATKLGLPDPAQPAVLPENYTVATGDKLKITVFQNEDLSKDYQVDLAGNIALPLIGAVPAAGRTIDTIRDTIASRLRERYMRNPDVTVAVTESSARNIIVDGSVGQPGSFPVRGRMTLMEAVALARGTNQDANPRRVAVFRRVSGQRMAAAFDLVSIRRGQAEDPEVYAGDVIVVDGNSGRSMVRDLFGALPVLALFRPY